MVISLSQSGCWPSIVPGSPSPDTERGYSAGFWVSVSPNKLEQPEIQGSGCIKNMPLENLGQPFFPPVFWGSKREMPELCGHSPLGVSLLQEGVSYSIFPFIYKFLLSAHTHVDFGKDVCRVEVNGVMTTASLSCSRTSPEWASTLENVAVGERSLSEAPK